MSSLLAPARTSRPADLAVTAKRSTRLGPARILGDYGDPDGVERSAVAIERPDGSVLVLDCLSAGLGDARLVGHIAREEPRENPALLARMYLADRCRTLPRRLLREDLCAPKRDGLRLPAPRGEETLCDATGVRFSIATIAGPRQMPELRWTRTLPSAGCPIPVSLRETLGALERYEPPRTLTRNALYDASGALSVLRLRTELARIESSPIVLNRGLREAVHRAVSRGASLSEIAMRCGRLKCDARGNRSGETSWLARRIGVMAEGGQSHPTPWIHSDTLALIACEGLGVSPREVEL